MSAVGAKPYSIPVHEFQKHVEAELQKTIEPQLAELERINTALVKELYIPQNQFAQQKNRYLNVLPSKNHRVKLKALPNVPDSDYINASNVANLATGAKQAYIATQAPVPAAIADFWRMVWEQNSALVLMLTKEEENSMNKAHLYWSEDTKEPQTYGDIKVLFVSKDDTNEDGVISREFTISRGSESRKITQLQFVTWPDHGVPKEFEHFLALFRKYRDIRSQIPVNGGPIVVHCSAGVGRTGTFIAVDSILDSVDAGEKKIDVCDVVAKLRTSRPSSIQTRDQYEFIYKFIAYVLANKGNKAGFLLPKLR